jgi:hypothetical protein
LGGIGDIYLGDYRVYLDGDYRVGINLLVTYVWLDAARRRDGVVLLVDGLLAGGHPEVRGGAHGHMDPLRSDNSSDVRPREVGLAL